MTQEPNSDGQNSQPEAELVGFSVVLVMSQHDPSIFNPDFLRHSNIVDKNLSVYGAPISTPVFSQVAFEGGLTITADPNHIFFEQEGNSLGQSDVHCPAMAKCFIEQFPHLPYKAVGLNPKGLQPYPKDTLDKVNVSNVLSDKGEKLSFKDTKPEVQLKVIYHFEKRTITLDVTKRHDKVRDIDTGILFQMNIHRNLREEEHEKRTQELLSIISSWKSDLADFRALVDKFDFQSFE